MKSEMPQEKKKKKGKDRFPDKSCWANCFIFVSTSAELKSLNVKKNFN